MGPEQYGYGAYAGYSGLGARQEPPQEPPATSIAVAVMGGVGTS